MSGDKPKTPAQTADDLGNESIDGHAVDRYEAENSSALAVRSLDDIKRLSTIFIGSGMFKGDKSLSQAQQIYQAGVKIIAGIEFGIQPFAAMKGLNIIKGNTEMSANLMAAKVKKHPRYEYTVEKWDREGCELIFWEKPSPNAPQTEWRKLGPSSFDAEDARIAGLAGGENWRKFARNMYFARAISNGVRIYTPDVFYGTPVYVEGEISGEFEKKPADNTPEDTAQPVSKANDAVEGEIVSAEPVEGELVGDEPIDPLEQKLDEIRELATELGHGDDWFDHVSSLINSVEDAEKVYAKLRTKQIEQEMNGE